MRLLTYFMNTKSYLFQQVHLTNYQIPRIDGIGYKVRF
jgi:hypothetical protein